MLFGLIIWQCPENQSDSPDVHCGYKPATGQKFQSANDLNKQDVVIYGEAQLTQQETNNISHNWECYQKEAISITIFDLPLCQDYVFSTGCVYV